jgi:hypothetical protein
MKTEAGDVTLIAVGGGAFLVPDRLAGISEVVRVPHGDCANAVGAATAQISGDTDQVYRALSRADAIAAAEAQAIARATEAGADPATITVIEVEDMPLAYLPGNAEGQGASGGGDGWRMVPPGSSTSRRQPWPG